MFRVCAEQKKAEEKIQPKVTTITTPHAATSPEYIKNENVGNDD